MKPIRVGVSVSSSIRWYEIVNENIKPCTMIVRTSAVPVGMIMSTTFISCDWKLLRKIEGFRHGRYNLYTVTVISVRCLLAMHSMYNYYSRGVKSFQIPIMNLQLSIIFALVCTMWIELWDSRWSCTYQHEFEMKSGKQECEYEGDGITSFADSYAFFWPRREFESFELTIWVDLTRFLQVWSVRKIWPSSLALNKWTSSDSRRHLSWFRARTTKDSSIISKGCFQGLIGWQVAKLRWKIEWLSSAATNRATAWWLCVLRNRFSHYWGNDLC